MPFSRRNTSIFFLEICSLNLLWLIFSPQINALILIGYYIFVKENEKHLAVEAGE